MLVPFPVIVDSFIFPRHCEMLVCFLFCVIAKSRKTLWQSCQTKRVIARPLTHLSLRELGNLVAIFEMFPCRHEITTSAECPPPRDDDFVFTSLRGLCPWQSRGCWRVALPSQDCRVTLFLAVTNKGKKRPSWWRITEKTPLAVRISIEMLWKFLGGCGGIRTCDPYDVNVVL